MKRKAMLLLLILTTTLFLNACSGQTSGNRTASQSEISTTEIQGTWERTDNENSTIYYLTLGTDTAEYLKLHSSDKKLISQSLGGSYKLLNNQLVLSVTMTEKNYLESYKCKLIDDTLILSAIDESEKEFAGTYVKSELPEIVEPKTEDSELEEVEESETEESDTPASKVTESKDEETNSNTQTDQKNQEFYNIALGKKYMRMDDFLDVFITFTSENEFYYEGGTNDEYYNYILNGDKITIQNIAIDGVVRDLDYNVEIGIYHREEHSITLTGDGWFSGYYVEIE